MEHLDNVKYFSHYSHLLGGTVKKFFLGILGLLICFSSLSTFPFNAFANSCQPWIAKAVSVEGEVEAKKAGGTKWRPVKMWDEFCPGDMVRLPEESRAAIVLVNGVILRLDQNTTITFNGMEKEASLIEILRGVVNFFSRWPRSLKIYTPFVNGIVEGTEFLVKVDDERTFISVFEGHVTAANKAGSIALTDGQSAAAKAGHAPVSEIVIHPRNAVQWALYYPTVIYAHPEKFKKDAPRYYIYRASSLLHVGRVGEAKADIEKALKIDPKNSQAFALEAIIAVTQNEKGKALGLAKKAVGAGPHSASALVALSYAQQASFDLKGALKTIEEAVKVEPENALAWARLAEMRMSFGELDRALEAANKAVALNPDVARTQTVLGFAYLTEVKIKQSKEAFEKAIELDKAAPLPRLGIGLAKIRDGDLVGGRKEIEIAVSLDPDNSLMRSYLGKAFYEEKREKMADDQYGIAEKLDPKDPTPYFYDAIKKQSINRPVEALEDMQKAIELNDDRAVYRSKLLLDSDLAARSASLARIYTDLGFQDRALVEGWQSVNADPADFSGHRFLADSYSALPRHEIARVSELLQSQLLQPINVDPVQPHLAESNLFILNDAGPSDLSLNEFNPLFNRDRYALQLSGIAGGHDTLGDEVVVSAVQGKISLSAGQFHYESDGWRENNDQRQNIYNLFAQYELSPKTSVQAEFRARDFNHGDLSQFFGSNNFLPNLRQDDDTRTVRLGFHHEFSPGSDIIGSAIYQHNDGGFSYSLPVVNFQLDSGADSYGVELQHLYRSERFNLIGGAGYFLVSNLDVATIDILVPPPPQRFTTPNRLDVHHSNLYLYSYINYPENVTFTLGLSADFYNGSEVDRNQANPKFGVKWNPFSNTTLRAAVFRTLRRTLLTSQTVEPTQIAGFNQFFDDDNATEAWLYGIGVDQKFANNVYGGIEYSQRDTDVPIFMTETGRPKVEHFDGKERFGRAYLYWTPHKWLALRAEYQDERLDGDEVIFWASKVRTKRVPLGVSFFHPSGFIATFKATYIDQDGEFMNQQSGNVSPGSDHFWLADALVGYRLPKRFGLITVGAKNLFDKSFNYHDIDYENPTIQPKRLIFGKVTLAF
jgi:Tfp pilus assembly protein PilF/opacity protein-like surface antigen